MWSKLTGKAPWTTTRTSLLGRKEYHLGGMSLVPPRRTYLVPHPKRSGPRQFVRIRLVFLRYATSTLPLLPLIIVQVGCSDGSWCFQLKNAHPDWIIEGIDDTDHWTCMNKDTDLRHGCMDQSFKRSANMKYRDSVLPKTMSQTEVKFKVRNLNCLLNHREPFPRNFYSFIRGRDIFDRTESYKNLLDDIRLYVGTVQNPTQHS
jgi:hypothetical protein